MQTVSRLIEQFTPEHYQLSLDIQQKARTFSGTITMNGTLLAQAKHIAVHAKDLIVTSVLVDGKKASSQAGKNDELYITQPDLAEGRHIVVIVFNGKITDGMHGIYPCFYEHDGVQKELIATQFESHHAREVFPCIDEPEAKATFDVTLTTQQDIIVLGNMPIRGQVTKADRLITTFDTTPRMSTYLLAWVTGELHKKTAVTKSGVEVNIWATPAQKPESLDFALDIARRTIDFFDEYFDTPYPLPKSDHVALPDFSSGAMENWGLVTYREIALLAEPSSTSISSKHYIATVIAHELSHQWFGNLVTMKWWNNLWLNESFATLMEYIAIDALHPEWDVWLDFASFESIFALRRDSLDGVQAVQVDVNHPDEISTLFDAAIVYAKGARLLRMLQNYIGHEAFQKGLKEYFAAHAYQNTEGNDLWSALSLASGKDITEFMNTWISQSGYPVVTVTRADDQVTLTQQQFFIGPHKDNTKLWPIPLNSTVDTLPALLSEESIAAAYDGKALLRLNMGDTAHFITQYDTSLRNVIISHLSDDTLAPLDRLQLLNEQILLAQGGRLSTAELIPLLMAYRHETAESVWDIISIAIGELKKFVESDAEAEKKLRTFAGMLARDQYERLGWIQKDNETETETKLRATIIAMMLYSEDEKAVATALEKYRSTDIELLDPELRSLILGAVVRHDGSPEVLDALYARYKVVSSEIQQDISSGLTSSKNSAVIEKNLALIKDATFVRPQDAIRWFVWTLRNRYGRSLAWKWLRDNWDWIEKTFGSDKSYDDFPRLAASALITNEQYQEYKDFFIPLQGIPALTRVITVGISEIEGKIALLERDGDAVRRVLREL